MKHRFKKGDVVIDALSELKVEICEIMYLSLSEGLKPYYHVQRIDKYTLMFTRFEDDLIPCESHE